MKTVGIVCERWKQDIFERHLRNAGYTWESAAAPIPDCVALKVSTENVEALQQVVKAASEEARKTGASK